MPIRCQTCLEPQKSYEDAVEHCKPKFEKVGLCEVLKPNGEIQRKFESGALRNNVGKLRVDLVPHEMITSLAQGLTKGAKKYYERNWERGFPHMSVYGSTMRHLLKWLEGQDIDEDTGVRHIELAFLNLGMIVTQTIRDRKDLDDRPSVNSPVLPEDREPASRSQFAAVNHLIDAIAWIKNNNPGQYKLLNLKNRFDNFQSKMSLGEIIDELNILRKLHPDMGI